jgi:hypothetical protein
MGEPKSLSEIASSLGTVSVEVEQLDLFYQRIEELMTDFLERGSEAVIAPLGETPVNFAGGGLVEGTGFLGPYRNCVENLGRFLGEAGQGLASLAAVSMLAGVHYVTGDTESAELLATVTDAFRPPPLPTDPAVWERLKAWDQAQREDKAAMETDFEDMVQQYQRSDLLALIKRHLPIPGGDPDSAFRLPYSDYYTNNMPLRGDGQFWPRPPESLDVQRVNRVDLPEPGESIIDDVDLRQPLPPEDIRDKVDAAIQEWAGYDGDAPGTEYDDPPDD